MSTALDLSQRYTYADYLTWSDNERWEIINGFPYNMSPAPSRKHQGIITVLTAHFHGFFKGKSCKVYAAPFDVRLSEDYSDDHLIENVVQPDLSVFYDKSKLDKKGAIGAPDLVVEVLSPSNADKDLHTKLLTYQKFGVKEYWVVDAEKGWVEVLVLDKQGRFLPGKALCGTDMVSSIIFPGLELACEEIFAID